MSRSFGRVPFKPQSRKEDFLLGTFFASIHAILVTAVYHYVPEPYMDEIFHIGQTRSYFNGNYTWNPLITTPPALYILAQPFCFFKAERYINSLLIFFTVPALCRFRRIFSRNFVHVTSSIVVLLPVLLQSSLLFYTDLLSLCTVIWGFTISNPYISSLFFFVSICTRQTNIVWAALFASHLLLRRIDFERPVRSTISALIHLWPFEFLAVSFIAFIVNNDGKIVLGDASAHQPCLHIAQFFYCLAFCVCHAFPTLLVLLPTSVRSLIRRPHIFSVPLFAYLIQNYTFSHPYLLADNRHFTFYLWRRVLSGPAHLFLSPVYLLSAFLINRSSTHIAPIYRILFFLSTVAVLVPAHLFEMRYYIIPYTLWRLSANTTKSSLLIFFEIAGHILLCSITFYLFLFKPFQWSHEPGILQRLMF